MRCCALPYKCLDNVALFPHSILIPDRKRRFTRFSAKGSGALISFGRNDWGIFSALRPEHFPRDICPFHFPQTVQVLP